MSAADVTVDRDGAVARISGESDDGVSFVDAWLLGVLSVEDSGRVTVTSEVVDELTRAAVATGLQVST